MQPTLGTLNSAGRKFLVLPTVLLMLNVVDVASSSYGLSIGLREVNPLFSLSAMVLLGKFFGCAALFATSYLQHRFYPEGKNYVAVVLVVLIFVYLLTTSNNVVHIFQVWTGS